MDIAIATISIMAIAGAALVYNRMSPFRVCPICAGVSGTWLWMLAAKFLGYTIDIVILAILMGGSVVGIAYQMEKHFAFRAKMIFIPAGFVFVYSFLMGWRGVFLATLLFLACISFLFLGGQKNKKQTNKKVEELEEKMKSCC